MSSNIKKSTDILDLDNNKFIFSSHILYDDNDDGRSGRIYNDFNLRKNLRLSNRGRVSDEFDEELDLEHAINLTGMGYFQLLIFFVCSFASMIPPIVPSLFDHFQFRKTCRHGWTDTNKDIYNFSTYFSMQIGYIVFALLSDKCGRKWTLIGGFILNLLGTVLLSLSHQFFFIIVAKSITTFTSSGISVGIIVYYSEFVNRHSRGFLICAQHIGNILGIIVFPCSTYGIRPGAGIAAPFIVLVILVLCILPESPRYLLSKGNQAGAKKSLIFIHNLNLNTTAEPFSRVKLLTDKHEEYKHKYVPKSENPPTYSIFILAFAQFILTFCYFTVSLLLSTMTLRGEMFFDHNSRKIRDSCKMGVYIVERSQAHLFNGTYKDPPKSHLIRPSDCYMFEDADKSYIVFRRIIVGLSPMPVLLWMFMQIDVYGRKFFIELSHVSMGCIILGSYFVSSQNMDVLNACLYDSFYVMAYYSNIVMTIEIVKTKHRALIVGSLQAISHLSLIFAYATFVLWNTDEANQELNCVTLIACMSFALSCCGFMVSIIPETVGVSLK